MPVLTLFVTRYHKSLATACHAFTFCEYTTNNVATNLFSGRDATSACGLFCIDCDASRAMAGVQAVNAGMPVDTVRNRLVVVKKSISIHSLYDTQVLLR
jgi:hypothetical protein